MSKEDKADTKQLKNKPDHLLIMTSALTGVKQAEAVQRAGRGWAVGTPQLRRSAKALPNYWRE